MHLRKSALVFNLMKWIVGFLVIVAPLRAYRVTKIAEFNLSLFRLVSLIMMSLFVLELVYQRSSLSIPQRVRFYLSLIWLLLISMLTGLILSPYLTEGDTITRMQVKIFGLFVLVFAIVFWANEEYLRFATQGFFFSAVIPVLIGLYQYIKFQVTRTIPLLPLHQYSVIKDQSSPGLGILYESSIYRITGTLLEPNYFGIYLGSVILVGLSLLVYKSFNLDNSMLRALYILLLGLYLLSLLLTFSISAIIGFCFGMGVLMWLTLKCKKRIFWNLIIILAMILILIVIMQLIVFSGQQNARIEDMLRIRIEMRAQTAPTLFGRAEYYARALESFAANPILGSGPGALATVTGGLISSGHNVFLTFLGELGLLGFMPLVVFFAVIFIDLYRKYKSALISNNRNELGLSLGLLAAMVNTVIANQFYDAMFYYDAGWVLVAITAAFAVIPKAKLNNTKSYI